YVRYHCGVVENTLLECFVAIIRWRLGLPHAETKRFLHLGDLHLHQLGRQIKQQQRNIILDPPFRRYFSATFLSSVDEKEPSWSELLSRPPPDTPRLWTFSPSSFSSSSSSPLAFWAS